MTDDAHSPGETVTPSARASVFVECLARALAAGDQAQARDLEVIGREMRSARFQRGFPQSPRYVKFRRLAIWATVLWVPVFLLLLMYNMANMPWLDLQMWVFGAIWSAVLSLLYAPIVLIAWLVTLAHHRTPRVGHRISIRTACPACEYDLRGVAPMLPVSTVGGVWLGPERCSECGVCWPLIPKELGGQDDGNESQSSEGGQP